MTDKRDIFVIGGSAGGVEAVKFICNRLPKNFPGTVFVVVHLAPKMPSMLPAVIARGTSLPVLTPEDGAPFSPGHVYVASPDNHLLVRTGHVLVRKGPQENRSRPSIDALFRAAAASYGPRVVGLVLTGLLDDGTQGLIVIKEGGGISVVQDPADALWPAMPANALQHDHVDYCLKLADIPALLVRLAGENAGPPLPLPPAVVAEDRIAEREFAIMRQEVTPPGHPSPLSCPICGGVLNEIDGEGPLRFRCQVGHAFTTEGLETAQSDELERALGIAVRTHRDRCALFLRMQSDAERRGLVRSAEHWRKVAEEAEHLAGALEHAIALMRKHQAAAE